MQTRLEQKELWPNNFPSSFWNANKEIVNYLKKEELQGKSIVDIGEANPKKSCIENMLLQKIDSFDANFDYDFTSDKKYDVIFCLEVLEHLYNPLRFLENISRMLNKDGIIYLSTPYQYPHFLKSPRHYHEIPSDRIQWLFDAANLDMVDKVKITLAGNWYNHIFGIRPMLRYFQKTRMYKLKLKS